MSCFVHELELQQLLTELLSTGADDSRLNTATPLITAALATVREDIAHLLDADAFELGKLSVLRADLDWFCAANQSLVDELRGQGYEPLATAKELLWLVELSMLQLVDAHLDQRT